MIFYFTLAIWILILSAAKPDTIINNKYMSNLILWSFYFLTTLLLAFNIDKFINGTYAISDTIVYMNDLNTYKHFTFSESLTLTSKEPFFTLFSWVIAQFTTSPYIYLLSIWFFISIILIKALLKIFRPWQVVLIFFSFVNYPFFLNYIVNGIRQGFAMTLLVFALSILLSNNNNRFYFYLSLILATLSHISAFPFALILIILKKFKLTFKISVSIWSLSAISLVTGLNQYVFGFASSYIDSIAKYTSADVLDRFSGINRLDFLFFSMIFLILSMYLYHKMKIKANYALLLNTYILFNSLYLLMGFIGFSNRLASYSWYLIPLLIWYPFLTRDGIKYNVPVILLLLISFLIIGFFTNLELYLF